MGFADFKDLVSWMIAEGKQLDLFAVTDGQFRIKETRLEYKLMLVTFIRLPLLLESIWLSFT